MLLQQNKKNKSKDISNDIQKIIYNQVKNKHNKAEYLKQFDELTFNNIEEDNIDIYTNFNNNIRNDKPFTSKRDVYNNNKSHRILFNFTNSFQALTLTLFYQILK